KINLDSNGFTEIGDLEIRGRWPELSRGKAERVSIKNITVSGEIDKNNRITIAGWDGSFGTGNTSKKQPLPFQSFYLENLTVDLDTPIGALRIQGKTNIDSDNSGRHIVTSSIFSSQQQLTTSINFKGLLDGERNLSGKAEIEDTSIDIDPIMISRLSGWIEFRSSPFTAAGQIMAGGMKYKDYPFEDGNLTFDTAQAAAGIFKTKLTGKNIFLNAELNIKPEKNLVITASAPSLGELASIADMENKILSQSGPVDIKAKVRLTDQFLPAKEIGVEEINAALSGGNLKIKPFTWYGADKRNSLILQFANMKLSSLLQDSQSITATGSISGVIPLNYLGSDIVIENGILRGDQPASFKYAPKELPPALKGDDPRMQTVRLALSDYHYDTLEFTMNGPLNGDLKTSLKAKGSSPAFDNRPVNLNLNLEGALASALRQALQPGTLSDTIKNKLLEGNK
ncbi:MAG: hypothetical protein DI586_09965, partial [Micavibrio aeruginosavorus]